MMFNHDMVDGGRGGRGGGGTLTFSRAQPSGSRDQGEGGASVHCPQVVLHVGADVRMSRTQRRLGCSGRQTDQGEVRDHRAARQSWSSVGPQRGSQVDSVRDYNLF